MTLVDHAGISAEDRASLVGALDPLSSLQDVVRWGFALTPPSDVLEVVIQDEYTHDVVMRWRSDLYLVFDTT